MTTTFEHNMHPSNQNSVRQENLTLVSKYDPPKSWLFSAITSFYIHFTWTKQIP